MFGVNLKNKIAVVTGGSSGIGWAVVRELLAEGTKVVDVSKSLEDLSNERKETICKMRRELPENEKALYFPLTADIGCLDSIKSVFAEIKNKFELVNLLICNAGSAKLSKLLDANNETDLQNVVDVNLMGTVHCVKQAYPLMQVALKREQACHVVVVNSLLGHRVPQHIPAMGYNLYPVVKHSLRALNEVLRREFQDKKLLRLSSISPGLTATSFAPDVPGPGFKILQPEDVARAILFILKSPTYVNVAELLIVPTAEPY